jgi:hypothetical protein
MELVSAAQLDALLAETLSPLLVPHGFVAPSRPRKWVHARPPLRDLFEIVAMKGASFVPRWSISLDFVPHIQGDDLRWHRTDKGALGDIVYDPVDFDPSWQTNWSLFSIQSIDGVREEAARVLPKAVDRALAWLQTFRPENLLERIEQHRAADRPGRRFAFENVVQQPLALAVLLARGGRLEEAHEVLGEAMAGGFVSSKAQAKLRALLDSYAG